METSQAGKLLQKMVELEMRDRGMTDPERMVGKHVSVSMQATDFAGVPVGPEYDATVRVLLGRLVAGGQLDDDPQESARTARSYVVTERGIEWLRGLGML